MVRPMNSVQRILMLTLVYALPFHSVFLVSALGPLRIWKEVLVLLLFCAALAGGRVAHCPLILRCFIFLIICHSILLSVISPDGSAVQGLQTYVFPLLLFLGVLIAPAYSGRASFFYVHIIRSGVLVTIFGLWLSFVAGPSFLLERGFSANVWDESKLSFAFYVTGSEIQRISGGFAGPAAFVVAIVPIFILLVYERTPIARRSVSSFLLLVGSIVGLFRSVFLALGILLIIEGLKMRSLGRRFIVGIATLTICLTAYSVYWVFTFSGSIMELALLIPIVANTLQGDSSTLGHLASMQTGLSLIGDAGVIGLGLGSVGPEAVVSDVAAVNIESSFLSLWVELGLIGLLFHVLFWVFIFILARPGSAARAIVLFLAIVGFFLPLQYYTESMYIIFLIIGLLLRSQAEKKESL